MFLMTIFFYLLGAWIIWDLIRYDPAPPAPWMPVVVAILWPVMGVAAIVTMIVDRITGDQSQ